MKRINRRQFGKIAGGAALLAPFVAAPIAGAGQAPAAPAQQAQPAAPEKKLKLTPEQEERVKQAVERRDRQLGSIRNYKLSYSAEPAFIFRVQAGSKEVRK